MSQIVGCDMGKFIFLANSNNKTPVSSHFNINIKTIVSNHKQLVVYPTFKPFQYIGNRFFHFYRFHLNIAHHINMGLQFLTFI